MSSTITYKMKPPIPIPHHIGRLQSSKFSVAGTLAEGDLQGIIR
jgi:hypothetical protein